MCADARSRETMLERAHFSCCSPAFAVFPPRTMVRSIFLLVGLLALKSDATVSLFRPVLVVGFAVAADTAVAVGSFAGFALKFALISCD